jgi:hypothetical protein
VTLYDYGGEELLRVEFGYFLGYLCIKNIGIQHERERERGRQAGKQRDRETDADHEFPLITFAVRCSSGSDMISICDHN